jgi:glucosylceramidase
MLTINSDERNKIKKNSDFWSMGHTSKFVKPNSKRIFSSNLFPESIQNVAYLNKDGSIVVVLFNKLDVDIFVQFKWLDHLFSLNFSKKSAYTLIWKI